MIRYRQVNLKVQSVNYGVIKWQNREAIKDNPPYLMQKLNKSINPVRVRLVWWNFNDLSSLRSYACLQFSPVLLWSLLHCVVYAMEQLFTWW